MILLPRHILAWKSRLLLPAAEITFSNKLSRQYALNFCISPLLPPLYTVSGTDGGSQECGGTTIWPYCPSFWIFFTAV